MIIVTGGAGFLGSSIVRALNESGHSGIIVVDRLGKGEKWKNLVNLRFHDFIHKQDFLERLPTLPKADFVIHMGACSRTTERDADYLMGNNFIFSRRLFDWCREKDSRIIYASSAATYGDGGLGYDDRLTDELRPLNMYGYTKKLFDQYVLASDKPRQWVGLRFFNVYGPNEYHKDDMASVVYHSYRRIKSTGRARLFKSYRDGWKDGEQKRDFIYVRDVVAAVLHFMESPVSGIYNCGTGAARTFNDLVRAVFQALELPVRIDYIDMPEGLEEKYQYFTEARTERLRDAGLQRPFHTLEEGIAEYVKEFLEKGYRAFQRV